MYGIEIRSGCLRRGTFLSPNKKVPKEIGPRGRFEQMRPPWESSRRFPVLRK